MKILAVVVWVAACGDGLDPVAEQPPDAEIDDRVRVEAEFRGDVDVKSIVVLFQNPDSTIALATRFDDEGRANARMQAGGFVSLLVGEDVLTYVSVRDGDVLRFERWSADTAITSVRVKVPEASGAQSYQLDTSCGQREIFGAQIQPLDVSLGDCGDSADMLVTAHGTENDLFVFRDEVVLQGQTIVFMGPYVTPERGTITVGSFPAGVNAVIAEQSLVHRSDLVMPYRKTAIGITAGAGTGALVLARPSASTLITHLEPSDGPTSTHIVEWQPAERDITLFWREPPRPYTSGPMYDVTSSTVSWGEGRGEPADGVHAEMSWTDDDHVRHNWELLAPRFESPTIALPILPDARLHPNIQTVAFTRLDSFRIDGGYDRTLAAMRLGRHLDRGVWFTDSDQGRVVYQALD